MEKLVEQEILTKAAQNIISFFIQKNKDGELSNQEIAEKAKVSPTTLREARNGKLKSISYEKVVLLSKNLIGLKVYEPERIKDIAALDSASDKETFLRRFSHLFEYSTIEIDLEKHLNSFEKMKIFWGAYSASNLAKDFIIEQMGEEGRKALEELLEEGIIREEDGILKGVTKNCAVSIYLAQKMAQACLTNFSHEKNKKERNWLSHQSDSVNEEFLCYWRKRVKSFFEEFCQTSRLPQYSGDIPFYFLQSCDTFLEKQTPRPKGEIVQ